MIISVDKTMCTKCKVCIKRMEGFCISEKDGYPLFDEKLCNTCQKCVAICPSRAILVNRIQPERIVREPNIDPNELEYLLKKRRSIKVFKDTPIPKELVEKIVSVGKYSPNQNKNISIVVIDNKTLISQIDKAALQFVKRYYKILFGLKVITSFIHLFYKDIYLIKRKMEHGNFQKGIYENIQVIILVTGDKKVAVTESSAHYVLATMMFMAETLGIGNCLMDTVYLAFRTNKKLRKSFAIREDVLGALVLGNSDEKIVNIPNGYEMNIVFKS
jgi:nitroreductase